MSEPVGYDFLGRPLHPGDLVYWGDIDGQSLAQVTDIKPEEAPTKGQVALHVIPTPPNLNIPHRPWWVAPANIAYYSSEYRDMNPAYIASLHGAKNLGEES